MSSTTLLLPAHVYETLIAHAEGGTPEEVCGVLLGTGRDSDALRVTDSRPVPNVADEPRTRYELDPTETAQRFTSVESESESDDSTEVVGFYHSHPRGPPGPSATDRAQAQWPGYVYLIVSLDSEGVGAGETGAEDAGAEDAGVEIGAWRWTGERFESVAVVVDDRADGETGSA